MTLFISCRLARTRIEYKQKSLRRLQNDNDETGSHNGSHSGSRTGSQPGRVDVLKKRIAPPRTRRIR